MRSEKAVRNLLLRNPASVTQERNRLGHTTLHLASGWPVGLKLLLDAGGAQIVNTPSRYGSIPLIYAHSNHCIDAMTLLIDAGSALSSPTWDPTQRWYLYCSEEALDWAIRKDGVGFDLVSTTMKQRQLKLKAIALQKLPVGSFEALGIPRDGILEGPPLYSLVRMLDEYKIAIPEELNPPVPQGTVYHRLASIFYNRDSCRTWPQRLFDTGFYCIDELNHEGLSPLASIFPVQLSIVSFALWYALWLLSKGANLMRLITSSATAATAAHHLAFNIGASIGRHSAEIQRAKACISEFQEPSRMETVFWDYVKNLDPNSTRFLFDLCLEATRDGCCCTCSSSGCTPFTVLLKGTRCRLTPYAYYGEPEQVQVWLLELIESIRQSLSVRPTHPYWITFANQVFHFATHQRLGLSHLCCEGNPRHVFRQRHDPIDVQYIQDDEAFLIAKHRELTAQFMDEYQRRNIPLSAFMKGYWQERMDQVLSSEDFVAEKFLDNVRRIGVDAC